MSRLLTRRQLFKASLATSAACGWSLKSTQRATAIDYPQPVQEANGLTAYQNGSNLLLRVDNMPLLGYRTHPTLKYPYFYPLNGPASGLPLTSESVLPYPHHRSLWLGCQPLHGGDYWSDNSLDSGRIHTAELALVEDAASEKSVSFTQRCEWLNSKTGSPLEDERRFVVTVASDRIRLLDCWFKLTAREDISIAKAKHSLFAMRAAPDISPSYGGVLMNSEGGIGAEGTYGKEAHWCGYHGRRRHRPEVVEGIAIMNHPENFGGDCPWFTRDYGHLSPSPFNFLDEPWTLAQGESLKLKYRVVLHAGDPQEAGLDRLYRQWLDSDGT